MPARRGRSVLQSCTVAYGVIISGSEIIGIKIILEVSSAAILLVTIVISQIQFVAITSSPAGKKIRSNIQAYKNSGKGLRGERWMVKSLPGSAVYRPNISLITVLKEPISTAA
eukprot:g66328.t1